MLCSYTAKHTRIAEGYMGQLVEWPEVVTEGVDLDECRAMLRDALHEMVLAYRKLGKEIPSHNALIEQLPVEIDLVSEPGVRSSTSNPMDSIFSAKGPIPPIYTNGQKTIPIKRHRQFDRITANELCKQAGLTPKYWLWPISLVAWSEGKP
jgi:predicted RNase H-like HicB family nuclease